MQDSAGNAASKGLTKKIIAATGFIVALGALVGAVNTVVTGTKSWVCGIGLPFSWCESPAPADTWSLEVGGQGGDPFNPITCRSDQALVGLYGKLGDPVTFPVIYSIAPICAPVRFNRTHQITSLSVEALSKGDAVGSSKGDPFELKCPSNMVVTGSEFSASFVNTIGGPHYNLVGPLALRCSTALSSADASSIKTVSGAGSRLPQASIKPFSCPDGSAAFGIKGRAGQYLDALSLGCRAYK